MTIFLDHNATTKIDSEVLNAMLDTYQHPYNNSTMYQLGRKADSLVRESIQTIQELLNAQNYQVVFTSGATEACNQVIFSKLTSQLFYSSIEHSCVYNCQPKNKVITEFNCNQSGIISIEDLEKKIHQHQNFLVASMLANNETGAIQPIADISKITHQKLGLVLCDITQAVGKIAIDLEQLNPDFAFFSAHKFYGPQGIGVLLIRKGIEIEPMIYGGKQQQNLRAGTLNISSIVGLTMACKLAKKRLEQFQQLLLLRNYLESQLKLFAKNNLKIFSESVNRLANTCFFAVAKINAQTQLINFDLNNIAVSSGSACSSSTINQSRILKAMKIDDDFIDGAIRVSLGLENTKTEIDKFIYIWHNFISTKIKN